MGKRSDFTRLPRDFYPTPFEAVHPLLPHLAPHTSFAEPCAGDGALIDALTRVGHHCVWATDTDPQRSDIIQRNALTPLPQPVDCFITNPPWSRDTLHSLITFLPTISPTWLLFDADWPHTRQASPFLAGLRKIVAIGRVKWIPNSPFTGKDNCCWYLFDKPTGLPPTFHGRPQ